MATKILTWSLLLFVLVGSAAAQASSSSAPSGSSTLPPGFGQTQAQLRYAVDPSLFLASYADISAATSPGGTAKYVSGTNNPALFTLPGSGIAAGVVTLASCALFAPHHHPRGSEVTIVISGNLSISFAEENAIEVGGQRYGGRVLSYTVPKGASLTIPQGLIHYINNLNCQQAQVITAFDNKDPGTVSVVSQLFQFPDTVVSAATGLDLLSVNLAKRTVSGLGLIGIDKECQARCSGSSVPPAAPIDPNLSSNPVNSATFTSVSNLASSPDQGSGYGG